GSPYLRYLGLDCAEHTISISGFTNIIKQFNHGMIFLADANDTITGGQGGDTILINNVAAYTGASDSFSNAGSTIDTNTDVINGFQDVGPPQSIIDLTNAAGGGSEAFFGGSDVLANRGTFSGGTPFTSVFTGGNAGDVDFAVIGSNTFVHLHQTAGYSA